MQQWYLQKLDKEVLIKIVGKFMFELKNMLKEKSVKLELTNEAIDYPVEKGLRQQNGCKIHAKGNR